MANKNRDKIFKVRKLKNIKACRLMDLIKAEELCGDANNMRIKLDIKNERLVKEETEELDNKSKETMLSCNNHLSVDTVKLEEKRGMDESDIDTAVDSKKENFVAVNEQELFLKPEEINIKTDQTVLSSFEQDGSLATVPAPSQQSIQPKRFTQKKKPSLECHVCGYKTHHRSNLRQHALIHKDASEMTMYKCHMCAYETPVKGNLKQHSLVHSTTSAEFNCKLCAYKSVRKANLKQHMLTHRTENASNITLHKCEVCLYETPRKGHLKQHMLIHKGVADLTMHTCEQCAYETPHKSNLNMHKLIHKTTAEVRMYKCDICIYKTKRKSSLKCHMLVHKSPTEEVGYTCEMQQGERKGEDYQDSN